MAKVDVHVVRAFVEKDGTGGNPAGVVVDMERQLGAEARLKVAGLAGFSETAFVSGPPAGAEGFTLEFFTPTRQIAHCGHATVATFSLLQAQGLVADGATRKHTVDGPRRIVIEGDKAFLQQPWPTFAVRDAAETSEICAALGVDAGDLASEGPVLAYNGNGTVIIGLRSQQTLRDLTPDLELIRRITERLQSICFYVYALETVREGRHAAARMFGPAYGIPEEAATGMAAGALGAWLREAHGMGEARMWVEQGWFMPEPSPSLIDVILEPDEVLVGGRAAVAGVLKVEV